MRTRCNRACGTLARPGNARPLPQVHLRLPKLRLRSGSPSPLILPHPPLLKLHLSCGQHSFAECVSSNPGRAHGAVGYLRAGDVVMRIGCPEENVVNHQYKSGDGDAEEIDNRHRHFHPNLRWRVGAFGPQLSGIARPPLRVPVQLLGGGGGGDDLSPSRFHAGRQWKGPTLTRDVLPDSR